VDPDDRLPQYFSHWRATYFAQAADVVLMRTFGILRSRPDTTGQT